MDVYEKLEELQEKALHDETGFISNKNRKGTNHCFL